MAPHDASFDPLIDGLARAGGRAAQRVPILHELMGRVADAIAYKTGVSTVDTTAVEALARGAGVAQDRRTSSSPAAAASTCRRATSAATCATTIPSLHVGRTSHSWAEAWVPGLDWVGFDPANNISPRGDSLRVAVGLDYRDAAPVSGRRVGFGYASMTVEASVRLVDT